MAIFLGVLNLVDVKITFDRGVFSFLISLLFILPPIILLGMGYRLMGDKLISYFWGFQYFSIKIQNIKSISRSYSPLASNAGSLKRLKIELWEHHKFPYMLISPMNESEFIEALKEMNPEINVRVERPSFFGTVLGWII